MEAAESTTRGTKKSRVPDDSARVRTEDVEGDNDKMVVGMYHLCRH